MLRWPLERDDTGSVSPAALYSEAAVNHQVAEEPVAGRGAMLEWRDPLGLRGCGFFHIVAGQIVFQRGYWDKLTFLRQHGLPIPEA